MNIHSLHTYDYTLPEALIAQTPHEPADECRFLVHSEGRINDTIFNTLPSLLDAKKHILFFNESKVLRARVPLKNAISRSKSGSEKTFDGEIFYLKPYDSSLPFQGGARGGFSEQTPPPTPASGGQGFSPSDSLKEVGSEAFITMVYPGDRFPVGGTIIFDGVEISVDEMVYEGRILSIKSNISVNEFLEKYGQMPLPPYVEYAPEKEAGYQPVFASKEGSVASPTASLHFTKKLLGELQDKGIQQEKITLHVGLGTFKNIYEEDIREFDMHIEMAEVSREIFEKIAHYKASGKTILAVGTTVTRTLESLPYLWPLIRDTFDWSNECRVFWDSLTPNPSPAEERGIKNTPSPSGRGLGGGLEKENSIIQSFSVSDNTITFESKIFIYPGFQIKIIDELITNFHLPKSTLLMLVSAFAGIDEIKKIYAHAVKQEYRFFSFGDAMWLRKANS